MPYKDKEKRRQKDRERWKNRVRTGRVDYRRRLLKRHYGITVEIFDSLLKTQKGKCKICKKVEDRKSTKKKVDNLSVDHCHKTGKVRGLLCNRCNRMLGYALDNPKILRNAAIYLEKQ